MDTKIDPKAARISELVVTMESLKWQIFEMRGELADTGLSDDYLRLAEGDLRTARDHLSAAIPHLPPTSSMRVA